MLRTQLSGKWLISAKDYTSRPADCDLSQEHLWQTDYFLTDSKMFRLLVVHIQF